MQRLFVIAMFIVPALFGINLEAQSPSTSSKIYSINAEEGTQGYTGYILKDVHSCSFEGITFLCGKYANESWLTGKQIYISPSAIRSIYEFASLEEYRESFNKYQPSAAK